MTGYARAPGSQRRRASGGRRLVSDPASSSRFSRRRTALDVARWRGRSTATQRPCVPLRSGGLPLVAHVRSQATCARISASSVEITGSSRRRARQGSGRLTSAVAVNARGCASRPTGMDARRVPVRVSFGHLGASSARPAKAVAAPTARKVATMQRMIALLTSLLLALGLTAGAALAHHGPIDDGPPNNPHTLGVSQEF